MILRQQVATERQLELSRFTGHRDSLADQRIEEAGEEVSDDFPAPRQQQVRVTRLGHTLARLARRRQVISLDDSHAFVAVGEHPGSHQPSHACAQHNRVLTQHRQVTRASEGLHEDQFHKGLPLRRVTSRGLMSG